MNHLLIDFNSSGIASQSNNNAVRQRLHWERGYRIHVLRDSKGRPVGRVQLCGKPPVYRWETLGIQGCQAQLTAAKRYVEEAVRKKVRQGRLFPEAFDE